MKITDAISILRKVPGVADVLKIDGDKQVCTAEIYVLAAEGYRGRSLLWDLQNEIEEKFPLGIRPILHIVRTEICLDMSTGELFS